MVITIAILAYFFALQIEKNLNQKINTKLSNSSVYLTHSFADIFYHTEFLMKNINDKIKQQPQNLEFIDNIISKYSVSPDSENSLSWTIFSWANDKDKIVVDAVYGVMQNPYDISSRD